jgi:hypothetical protein
VGLPFIKFQSERRYGKAKEMLIKTRGDGAGKDGPRQEVLADVVSTLFFHIETLEVEVL